MPFLLLVIDQIEQRGMPGEFALLPYVESNYVPTASGGSAAGIWQLMPDTARENGLRVGGDFDARLDVPASTSVALDLLQRYYREFGDWHLADMAFNAGENRVKKALSSRAAKLSSSQVQQLGLSDLTHAHFARLMALACIVSDPLRYGLKLPETSPDDILDVVDMNTPIDLGLAAHLSGMKLDQLRYLNSGYLHARMPARGPFQLLLPAAQRDALQANLSALPGAIWPQWHAIVLRQPEPLSLLASAYEVEPQVLAAANLFAVDARLQAGTRVLVPGAGKTESQSTTKTAAEVAAISSGNHVVQRGDTLSSIAYQARVSVDDLCRWNGLDRFAILKLGRRLHLYATRVDTPISAASTIDAN
ncbi:MAG: transglycosylase SLT domain-containing protein [Rudaea sp.]